MKQTALPVINSVGKEIGLVAGKLASAVGLGGPTRQIGLQVGRSGQLVG